MKIENKLRNFQDQIRDAGWRIKWIPWQEQGRPEYVYNTPFTLITGLGGAALFIGALIWLMVLKSAQPLALAAAAVGLLMIIFGRIYAAFNKQSDWICIDAACIEREIKQCEFYSEGNMNYVWEYRVLCEFTFNGRKYRVTPEASHIMSFVTESGAQDYLNERIQPDGKCRLWIDPRNPVHGVFDKKQRI